MKVIIAGLMSATLALSGCSSPSGMAPTSTLPLTVGNGSGAQYGNYAAQAGGEMRNEAGERCVLFSWDRPLTQDLALRLQSASCESKEHPGWMACIEIARTVIPMAQSTLANEQETH